MEKGLEIDFFGNGLCGHCHTAKSELFEFGLFHDETEESWKIKDTELQNHISGVLKEHPEKKHYDIIDHYSWDLHQNQYKYPNIHRESLIITIYNFLEVQLNELCSILEECIELKVKLNHLNGKGIERALSYLTKVAEFDLALMGKELPFIKGVNQVRNQIVHNAGRLPEAGNHKANIFIAKAKNLSGEPGGLISVSPDFISEFITSLAEFFDKLDGEVQRFIQSKSA
jgi:hypothetical protein